MARDSGVLTRSPDYGEQQSICFMSLKNSWEVLSFVMMGESNWSNSKQKNKAKNSKRKMVMTFLQNKRLGEQHDHIPVVGFIH